ncbi:PBP1A family penicillin-binding protein [Clostridium sp. MSJ-8]|uniref:transglycosylase domain-containing protein n=1 Tax=Clostridium sp. MSJ-8 TaxID=2841510 RepID=UPI001C0F32DD|nr:PBP1A family penicillin-binding protein [Clostridium sp. MSJ-8]MBU5487161.1 PBP1A family penicillin-binding protein [Clostridium sp. MSJ-8]
MATNNNNNNKNQAKKSNNTKKVSYPYNNKATTSSKSNQAKNVVNNKTSKKKKKKKRSLGFRIFKGIFLTVFFLCLTITVIGLGYVFAIIKSTPDLDVNAVKALSEPTSVYDDNGEFMDNLISEVDRNVISYEEIPQNLKDAFTSIEDQRFYTHFGIDPIRIVGSFVTDVKKVFSGNTQFHGGSTITQQLLKNTILTNESSQIERKIKEMWLAIQLEKQLSKDEILCLYLNTIPMGGTAYGVDAAANLYFAKPASQLNLIECAYIAGITQAPTTYSAYSCSNKETYINRTKTVLSKMLELGKISQEEYNQAITDIDNGGLVFSSTHKSYKLEYEWYINPTIAQVKEDLINKYKYTKDEVSKLLANGGLKIYTNMNRELQDYAQQVLDETTVYNGEEVIPNSNTPAFQAACTIVDYHTGSVKVVIGGRGEHTAQSTNRAYSELRSIGSCTKPLTVYGPAINEKILTAASTIDDAPIPESEGLFDSDGTPYNPNNDDFKYAGNVTLRDGIMYSKNVVAVLVENKLGVDTGKAYGKEFGLKYNDDYTGIATLALGQFRNDPKNPDGGTPYILASAFGVFGNKGVYTEPRLYSKVEDASGNVILDNEVETKEIFSKQTAYIMYDLLKGSRSYTGPSAQWGSMPTAGKTGTPTDFKDLWFSGLTPYYSGSVWLGYYNSSVNLNEKYGLNSNSAAAVWAKIMEKAHEGLEVKDIEQPSGITTATVCKDSGKLATSLCSSDPRGNRVYTEMFIEGTEPTSYCDAHVNYGGGVLVKKANPNPVTADYPYLIGSTNYSTNTKYRNSNKYNENNNNENNNETNNEDNNDNNNSHDNENNDNNHNNDNNSDTENENNPEE